MNIKPFSSNGKHTLLSTIFFILVSFPGVSSALALLTDELETNKPCPHVHIHSSSEISFSKQELIFICGDPAIEEWRRLPLSQIKTHLKGILQDKGHLDVEFEMEKGVLIAKVADKVHVKSLRVSGRNDFNLEKVYVRPIGKTLTPSHLDEIESWFYERLLTLGYPCANIDIEAFKETAEVHVKLEDLEIKKLLGIAPMKTTEFKPGTLHRYHAFHTGEVYNHELMVITSRRIINSGILTNHRFIHKCREDGVSASQVYSMGKPKLISLGAGANTELGPIFKAAWRHARIGDYASTIGASFLLSYREQTLRANADWYLLGRPSRFHLSPVITLSRQDESLYETRSSEVALLPSTSYDNNKSTLKASLGPSFRYDRQFKGVAPVEADYYGFRGEFLIESHKHEYWRTYPRDGHMIDASFFSAHQGMGSTFSATVLRVRSKHLFNLKNRVPAWLILGLRTKLNMTFSSLSVEQSFILPTYFRHFLGGLSDIRGFSRKDIPGDSLGGLGTAYVGFEAGSDALFHENLRPFLFIDLGAVGERSFQMDFPLYWSPGAGMRWQSPIGAFRVNVARGYSSDTFKGPTSVANSLQFHVSLGEEF